ncbi:hypothetical protein PSTT_16539 [Puccinia striiformis]|uniref:Long-chain-alcohol oxidase n=1 Tax=Puccinia striiformis TaxID=27350 RepID=A0A2S4UCW0_9BASI|nr:hypothetical protein PSTT_16539 [Puccinia striiformis]
MKMANEIHRPITTTTAAAGHPFSEDQLRLLAVILDTVFAAEPGSAEGEQQDDTAARQLSSYDFSCLPDFKLDDLIQYILQSLRPKELEKFRLGLTFLSSSTITFALTGYYSSFLEIPKHERQRILAGWSSSFLPLKRSLYSAFVRLPISAIYSNSRVVQGLIGYPSDGDPRASSLPERRKPSYPYKFVQPPSVSANENLLKSSVPHLDVYETDVIVIGSGAGGSVVASLVAKAGYKTLVIEKGRWVPTEHITGSHHGFNDMLEGNGQISTVDGSLIMLLGTTFGGGTTINWSASLAPPYHVRREWAEEHGLKYFGTSSFGKDIEAVSTRMGVSAKDIELVKLVFISILSLKILLVVPTIAGCVKEGPFGEKQGAAQTWLKDCAESGGEFMQNGRVERILFSNESNPREIEIDPTKSSPNSRRKYAVGVIVCDSTTRKRSIIRARRAVVSSSGAINTPALLLRSGIHLNGAVGKGLHLHPVTAVTAWFDTQVKPWEGSIMTLISCEVENRLGTHYGAKLEVFASNPGFYSGLFVPWKSSESHKELMSRYAQSFTIVVLTRDRGSGRVSVEEGGNGDAIVDYTVDTFDAQSLLEGILIACQALAAAGASEIATTLPTLDHFKFETTAENHNQSRFENWLNGIKKAGVKPGYGVLGSAHQMSSCRMGSKPSKDSVVSEQGKVWEHENLWVADGSVLPTSTGIMSVAHHIGNQIVDHLKDEDRSSSRKTLSKL